MRKTRPFYQTPVLLLRTAHLRDRINPFISLSALLRKRSGRKVRLPSPSQLAAQAVGLWWNIYG